MYKRDETRTDAYSFSITIMFTVISLLFLFVGSLIPAASIAFYFLSGMCIMNVMFEEKLHYAIISFGITAFLSVLIIPDFNFTIPYIILFGHYGIFKYYMEQKKFKRVSLALKYIYFSVGISVIYFVYPDFFNANYYGLPAVVYIIIIEVAFFFYDKLYSKLSKYYENYIRKILKNTIY